MRSSPGQDTAQDDRNMIPSPNKVDEEKKPVIVRSSVFFPDDVRITSILICRKIIHQNSIK